MTSRCRFCGSLLEQTFVDLGTMPLANSYPLTFEEAAVEPVYPLHARVCGDCFLVQVESIVDPSTIFSDYLYFSSVSESWSEHARRFAQTSVRRLGLDKNSSVIEIASNDGYLLRHFREYGVRVLGIDPAINVAEAAEAIGIPTLVEFFGTRCARRLADCGLSADLVVANNVLAHVPDLNDFVAGTAIVVKATGVVVFEFPHVLRLIEDVQFDTIYHEHFSYFSLLTLERVLAEHGLAVFDVERLATHGGSLRVWAAPSPTRRTPTARVDDTRVLERAGHLDTSRGYERFSTQVDRCRRLLQDFLGMVHVTGEEVVAYGAAAKGNTLLNYCNVRAPAVACVVDRSPHKQGRLLPGSHLRILAPERVTELRPSYLLVLAWNLRDEICSQMAHIRDWGGRFVFPIPEVQIA